MKNIYDFYIAPAEYDLAEKNGISKQCLEVRIRNLGWTKFRALNEKPLKFNRLPKEWIDIARKNGICYSTFKYRVNILKLNIEIAATKPLQDRKLQAKKACEASRKYPKEYKDLALKNGISERTFHKRLESGWDLINASTKPLMTNREIGLLTKEKRSHFVYGNKYRAATE